MVSAYLDSLREIERRIQNTEKSNLSKIDLPDAPIGVPNDFNEHLNLMFDLLAVSYQANLTRIFTFMMGKEVSMRTFNNVGVPDAFHPLSHHGNNPANLDRLSKVFEYHSDGSGAVRQETGGDARWRWLAAGSFHHSCMAAT